MSKSTAELWGLVVSRRISSGRRSAPAAALVSFLFLLPLCSTASADVIAEALFQVDSAQPVLIDNGGQRFNARQYEIFQKTQLALLKSNFVLTAAVRDPGIATLSILAGKDDPVAWLSDHLEVEFLDNSENLSIRIRGSDSHREDLKRLVDAVAKAYGNEVIYNERRRRPATRDTLAKTAEGLREGIVAKMAEIEQLKKEKGADGADSPEVRIRQIDLDIHIDVYRQLRLRLELEGAESNAPPRIRLIQPAMVRLD